MHQTLTTSGPSLMLFFLLGLFFLLLFIWLTLALWVSVEIFPARSFPSILSHGILYDLVSLMSVSSSPHGKVPDMLRTPLRAHFWLRTWYAVGTDHVCGEEREAIGFCHETTTRNEGLYAPGVNLGFVGPEL